MKIFRKTINMASPGDGAVAAARKAVSDDEK
jgi:hypothetical protein